MKHAKTFAAVIASLFLPLASARAALKVDEISAAPWDATASYSISANGLHVGYAGMKGSKYEAIVDGVEGPKFDEIYRTAPNIIDVVGDYSEVKDHTLGGMSAVALSPDGRRYAYTARQGSDVILMLDGKEVLRKPVVADGVPQPVSLIRFSPDGKHFYYHTGLTETMTSIALVMDGQPGPSLAEPAFPIFSSDGAHWAYKGMPAKGGEGFIVEDGKVLPYVGNRIRFSNDGKHLVSLKDISGASAGTAVFIDGKQMMSTPTSIRSIVYSATGDMGVVSDRAYINGKEVPGSEGANHITFSPDGKRTGISCQTGPSGWVSVDGKKGESYASTGICNFTADSSKYFYTAAAGNKMFVIIDGQESDGYNNIIEGPRCSPDGGSAIAYVAYNGNTRVPVVNGKAFAASQDVENLTLAPNGSHYAFLATDSISSRDLIVDGKPAAITTGQNQPMKYSPDGTHLVTFGTLPKGKRAIIIDGTAIPVPTGSNGASFIGFTPDSKHLIWKTTIQKGGVAAFDYYADGNEIGFLDTNNPSGLLADLVQIDKDDTVTIAGGQSRQAFKRFKVTLGDDSTIATWISSANDAQANASAAATQKAADDQTAVDKKAADKKAAAEKAAADKKAAATQKAADKAAARNGARR